MAHAGESVGRGGTRGMVACAVALLLVGAAPASAEEPPPPATGQAEPPAIVDPGPPADPEAPPGAQGLPAAFTEDLGGPSPWAAVLGTTATGAGFAVCHTVGAALVLVYGGFVTLWLTGLSVLCTSGFSVLVCGPLYLSALGAWLGTLFPVAAGCINCPPALVSGPLSWGLTTLAARRRVPLLPVTLAAMAPSLGCWGLACTASAGLTTVGISLGVTSWLYWLRALFRQTTLPVASDEHALVYAAVAAGVGVALMAGAAVLFTVVNGQGHLLSALAAGAATGLTGRRRPPNEGPFNFDLWTVPAPEPLWLGRPHPPEAPPAVQPEEPPLPEAPESELVPRAPDSPPVEPEPAQPF